VPAHDVKSKDGTLEADACNNVLELIPSIGGYAKVAWTDAAQGTSRSTGWSLCKTSIPKYALVVAGFGHHIVKPVDTEEFSAIFAKSI
jgi:hypothetical protein